MSQAVWAGNIKSLNRYGKLLIGNMGSFYIFRRDAENVIVVLHNNKMMFLMYR